MLSAPNTNLSQDISSHPPKKMCKDKAKWTDTEEAAIITTLLEQKAAGNTSESGFKPSVWPLVEFSVSKATVGDVRKNVLQCKTCYHKVSLFFGLLSCMHLLTDLPYSCVPFPCPLPTSLSCVINQLMLMPAGSVQFSLTPTEVSSQLLVFTIYSDISPTYSHIPLLIAHIPFPCHQQTNADACRFRSIFTHTCTGKFSIVCVCNLILTYHLLTPIFPCRFPMSLACVINKLMLMQASSVQF